VGSGRAHDLGVAEGGLFPSFPHHMTIQVFFNVAQAEVDAASYSGVGEVALFAAGLQGAGGDLEQFAGLLLVDPAAADQQRTAQFCFHTR